MGKSYRLRSRFEGDGIFWDAKDASSTFPAHLSSASHLELKRAAEVAGPESWFPVPTATPAIEHVLGFTGTTGPCTLIGLHELPTSGDFISQTGQVLRARRFRVGACIVGCHLESDDEPLLRSGRFEYSGIGQWLPGLGESSLTDAAISVSYPKKVSPLLDVYIPSIESRIELTVKAEWRWNAHGFTARTRPVVTIEPAQLHSLRWFIDLAQRLEHFFALCLGSAVCLRSASLDTTTGESGWFMTHRWKARFEKPHLPAWVQFDSSQVAAAIAVWIANPEIFRPFERVMYGAAARGTSSLVDAEFLVLAKAVESFHRVTGPSTMIPKDSFESIRQSLIAVIDEKCKGSAIATRLEDSIRYCNEPSFHQRIESLISSISPTTAQELLGDAALFEQTLRQTRNYFTHPGIKKGSKVLTEGADLFLFNQRLHAFLRLLMLLRLGFPEEQVCTSVTYQARRWAIL